MLQQARQQLEAPSAVRGTRALVDQMAADQAARREDAANRNTSIVGDVVTGVTKGGLQIPGALLGLGDLAAGAAGFDRPWSRAASALGEFTGFQPSRFAEEIGAREYTRETLDQQAAVSTGFEEDGFSGGLKASLTNPRALTALVAEAAPSTVAGGLIGRGVMAAGNIGRGVVGTTTAGAVGEGVLGAGFAMAGIDESVDPQRAAAAAAATGVTTAAFALAGGRLSQRYGLGDPETILAGGRVALAPGARNKNLLTRVTGGAISEGLLQELPQGVSEQIIQNWAEGTPLYKDVDRAAVDSMLAGAAMGGGFNIVGGRIPTVVDATNPTVNGGPRADGAGPARQKFDIREAGLDNLQKAYGSFQTIAQNTPQFPDQAQTALRQMGAIRAEMRRRGLPEEVVNAELAGTEYIALSTTVRKLSQSYQDAVASDPSKAQKLLKALQGKQAAMAALSGAYPELPRKAAQVEYNELVGVGRRLADELARARKKKDGKGQVQLRTALAANKTRLRDLRDEFDDPDGEGLLSFTGEPIQAKGRASRQRSAATPPVAAAPITGVAAADAFVDDTAELAEAPQSPALRSLQTQWAESQLDDVVGQRLFKTDGSLKGGTDPKRPKGYWEKLQRMSPQQLLAERERTQDSTNQSALWQGHLVEALVNNDAQPAIQEFEQAQSERLSRPLAAEDITEAFGKLRLTPTQRERFDAAARSQDMTGAGVQDAADATGVDRTSVRESVGQVWQKLVKQIQLDRQLGSFEAAESEVEAIFGPSPKKQEAARRAESKARRASEAAEAAANPPVPNETRVEQINGQAVTVETAPAQLSPAEQRAARGPAAPAVAPAVAPRATGNTFVSDAEARLSIAESEFIEARDSGDPVALQAAEAELAEAVRFAEGEGALADPDQQAAAADEFTAGVAAQDVGLLQEGTVGGRSRDLQNEGPDTLRGFLNSVPLSEDRVIVEARLKAIKAGTEQASADEVKALRRLQKELVAEDREVVNEIVQQSRIVDKLQQAADQLRSRLRALTRRQAQLPSMQRVAGAQQLEVLWTVTQRMAAAREGDPAFALAFPEVTWDFVFADAGVLQQWTLQVNEALAAAGIEDGNITSASPKQRAQLIPALVRSMNNSLNTAVMENVDGSRTVRSTEETISELQEADGEFREALAAAREELTEVSTPVTEALQRLAAQIGTDPASASALDKAFGMGEMLLNVRRASREGRALLASGDTAALLEEDRLLAEENVESLMDDGDAPALADGLTQPAEDFLAEPDAFEDDGTGGADVEELQFGDDMVDGGYSPTPADTALEAELVQLADGAAAAQWAVDNAPNKALRLVAKLVQTRLKSLLGRGVTFKFEVYTGLERPRHMAASRGRATIDRSAVAGRPFEVLIGLNGAAALQQQAGYPPGTSYETVLHELLHAVTSAQIKWAPNSPGVKELTAVFNNVVGYFNDRVAGGAVLTPLEQSIYSRTINTLANPRELLAWGLSNGDVSAYLKTIASSTGGPAPSRSLLARFVDAVMALVGAPRTARSAFSDLLAATTDLTTAPIDAVLSELAGEPVLTNISDAQRTLRHSGDTQGRPIAERDVAAALSTMLSRQAYVGNRLAGIAEAAYNRVLSATELDRLQRGASFALDFATDPASLDAFLDDAVVTVLGELPATAVELERLRNVLFDAAQVADAVARHRALWKNARRSRPSGAELRIETELLQLNTVEQLAGWTVENAPNDAMTIIAERVQAKISRLSAAGAKFRFNIRQLVVDGDLVGAGGLLRTFNPTGAEPLRMELELNSASGAVMDPRFPSGMRYDVILHELVHAATAAMVSSLPNSPVGRDLQKLFTTVSARAKAQIAQLKKDQAPAKLWPAALTRIDMGANTLADVDELIAWGLTDPDFQAFLASINLGPKRTAWSSFVDIVAKVLGLSQDYHSALDELLTVSDQLFEAGEGPMMSRRQLEGVGRDLLREAAALGAGQQSTSAVRHHRGGDSAYNRVLDRLPPDARFSLNTLRKKVRQLGGLFMFTADFVDFAEGTLSGARDWFETVQRRVTERNNLDLQIQAVVDPVQRMSRAELRSLNTYLKAATVAGEWGFDAYAEGITQQPVTVTPAAAQAFNELNPTQASVAIGMFRQARLMKDGLNRQMAEDVRELYDGIIERAATTERAQTLEAERDAQIEKFMARIGESQPAYLPLKRFGEYATVWKSREFQQAQEAGDAEYVAELKQQAEHYQVIFSETFNQSQREAAAIEASAFFDADGALDNFERARVFGNSEFLPFNMLEAIKARFESEEVSLDAAGNESRRANLAAMSNALNKYYVEALNEESSRKSELARLNVSGASEDMVSAFITHATSMNATISALRTNRETQVVLQGMRNQARESTPDPGLRDRRNELLNEIESRHRLLIAPVQEPTIDKVMGATSIMMLLSSPAYYIQNATQPFMISLPWLGGEYGVGKASAAMSRAYTAISKVWVPAIAGDLTNITEATVPDPNVRLLFRRLEELGLFDIGIAADLGSFRQDQPGFMGVVGRVHRTMIHGVRSVELFNRGVTAAAAYELEMAKSGVVDTAIARAVEAVQITQGDYGVVNAPRVISKIPLGRLVTQFRKFQLIQIGILARSLHKAFRNASPAERAIGRKQLGYILATHGAMGGLLGLPAANLIGFVIANVFGSDDEPDDAELMARRAIGNPAVADLILKGLPTIAGMDISSRVGMGYTFALLPFSDTDLSRDGARAIIAGALGPTAAQFEAAWDGAGMVAQGNTLLGIAQMMPRGIRDALRATSYRLEGVTRRNAERDVVLRSEDLSALDIALQGMGWPTKTLTDAGAMRRWLRTTEDHFSARASSLRGEYVRADNARRMELRREWGELQKVRRDYGFSRQPLSQLIRAPRAKAKREQRALAGTATRPGNRGFVESLTQ